MSENDILSTPPADNNNVADKKGSNAPSLLRTELLEWLEMFALYFAIGITVLLIFFRHCPVVGESMLPTLRENDMLIVRSVGYTPEQGDIIVCQSPSYSLDQPLVKRVIATGGQTVSINYEKWQVTVDGVTLAEDYIAFRPGQPMADSGYLPHTFTVPDGSLFVMGDNRNASLDSRSAKVGFIDERYVIGKVSLRLLPFSDFEIY